MNKVSNQKLDDVLKNFNPDWEVKILMDRNGRTAITSNRQVSALQVTHLLSQAVIANLNNLLTQESMIINPNKEKQVVLTDETETRGSMVEKGTDNAD